MPARAMVGSLHDRDRRRALARRPAGRGPDRHPGSDLDCDPGPDRDRAPGSGRRRARSSPGTAADQALWAAGRKASEDVVISRTRAGRLQTTVRSHRLVERLTTAEKAAGADRDRFEDLREELVERWEENYEVFSRRWPVDPTRGCGYPLLNLESAMHVPEGTEKASELSVARAEVRACLDRSALAVRAMEQANRELEGSIAKAQAALAAAERAAAAAPSAPPAKAE